MAPEVVCTPSAPPREALEVRVLVDRQQEQGSLSRLALPGHTEGASGGARAGHAFRGWCFWTWTERGCLAWPRP